MTTEQQLLMVDLCTLFGVSGIIMVLSCLLWDVWFSRITLLPDRAKRLLTVILIFSALSSVPLGMLANQWLKGVIVDHKLRRTCEVYDGYTWRAI